MTDYPIFDETYREGLNKKILNHYELYEIGYETPTMFAFFLNVKLAEIMPYYNELYKSAKLSFEPFETVNKTITRNGTIESDTSGNSNTDNTGTAHSDTTNTNNLQNVTTNNLQNTTVNSGENKTIMSDTASNIITNIESEEYATKANIDKLGTTQTATNTGTSSLTNTGSQTNVNEQTNTGNITNEFSNNGNTSTNDTEIIKGKGEGVSYSELLSQYRETLLNIDILVINELSGLFMQIY